MKHCSIISFIENDDQKLLGRLDRATYVICADTGYGHAMNAGIVPDLIIGDFDSYRGKLPSDIPVITLPSEKDDTDTGLCISYAIEHGFDDITIYGGLGGRLDHTLANLQLIAASAQKGISIRLIDISNEVYAVSCGSIELSRREACYISVFSASDRAQGVSLSGVKYTACDISLTNTFPLGVSNEFTDDTATISVADGTLLIIISYEKSA